MKNFEEFLKQVERELLANLLVSLKTGRLDKKEAAEVSKEFLAGGNQNLDDLFSGLLYLSEKFPEARKVFVKYAPAYYEERDMRALEQLRNYALAKYLGGDNHGS